MSRQRIVTAEMSRCRFLIGCGLGFALLVLLLFQDAPWLSRIRDPIDRHLIGDWSTTAALVAIVIFIERRALTSLGFARLGLRDVWRVLLCIVALGGSFVIADILIFTVLHLHAARSVDLQFARMAHLTPLLKLAIALTAGVIEEVMIRGYLLERIERLTGNLPLAISLCSNRLRGWDS